MDPTTTPSEISAPPYELDKLIVQAFCAARDRGKADWRRMKIAVLKNRLLQLSRGAFAEKFHGAESFRDLVGTLGHLIRVEGDEVELLDEGREGKLPVARSAARGGHVVLRIRPDLWKAIVDYMSGKTYVWDAAKQVVRAGEPTEALRLPTISRNEMKAFREKFATERGRQSELAEWIGNELGTRGLPVDLRGPWTEFIRDQLVQRLNLWFSLKGIQAPEITETVQIEPSPEAPVEELRRLVLQCVTHMTQKELEELRIPPQAILRAQRARRS